MADTDQTEMTPPEILASKAIDAWVAAHGKPIPWAKAVEIMAVITHMPDTERQRLLSLAEEA
jgi:hypothetical protein